MKHLLLSALLATGGASAQHAHAPAGTSPYTHETTREIKALSAQEQQSWLQGAGAGLALAAELNGYPGPLHVLEHAAALQLTTDQAQRTRALMDRHKAEVRGLGEQLVELERRLDRLFAQRHASADAVEALTRQVAAVQGRIRASHLVTHLEQTALLDAAQVADYQRLRGYAR